MSKPLFPLFPSASSAEDGRNKAKELSGGNPKLDWLANTSFAPGTVASPDNSVTRVERKEDTPISESSIGRHGRQESDHPQKKKPKKEKVEKAEKIEYKPNTIWLEESGLQPERAYRVDSKSDRANYQYGSLYTLDVASFKRHFHDQCLGLDNVSWESDDESGSSRKARKRRRAGNREGRYFGQELKNDINVKRVRILPQLESTPSEVKAVSGMTKFVAEDYLTLSVNSEGEPQSQQQLPAGQMDDSEDAEGLSTFEECTQKTKQFNETLRDHPHDIATWLAYANFQASWQGDGDSANKDHMLVEAERKAAILEKGLMKNPRNVDLLRAHLETCAVFWDGGKLAQKWKEIVFKNPNRCKLWQDYIAFAQSRFSSFSVQSVQAIYHRCFSTLGNIVDGTMVSHPPEPGTVIAVLDIFTAYCHFLSQTGHSEKATACYQAQIEYNLFCPDEFSSMPAGGQRAFLETFWDSGVPRFGQQGAKGWKKWNTEQKQGRSSDSTEVMAAGDGSDPPKEPNCVGLGLTEAWLAVEQHREDWGWLPWQPDASKGETDDDLADPDRMVLYDDVSPSLFKFADGHVKCELVLRFVDFLMDRDNHGLMGLGYLNELENGVQIQDSLLYRKAIDGRFGLLQIDADSTLWIPANRGKIAFVRELFSQIQSVVADPAMKELFILRWIEFELNTSKSGVNSKQSLKRLKRNVKSILKEPENRNNLTLWSAYAVVECVAGNAKEAGQVLAAALQLTTTTPMTTTRKDSSLAQAYRMYAELQLLTYFDSQDAKCRQAAINALVSFAERTPFNPGASVTSTRILKGQKQLVNDAVTAGRESKRLKADVFICSVLFDYLTRSLKDAVVGFRAALADEAVSGDEHIHQALVGLLSCHARTHTTPLHVMREALQEAIRRFPDSPTFVSLYVECERSLHVVTRRRRTLDVAVRAGQTCTPWMMSVLSEWLSARQINSQNEGECQQTGFLHKVRSLLNRAAEKGHLQRKLLVWRIFMLFELQQGNQERAKAVFYRALQHCPWAKKLYMDGVKRFAGDVDEIMSLIEEKEIRIRAPIEEVDLLMKAAAIGDDDTSEETTD
eukprot:m.39800 g.39800  ORF g.39800 m.39800 type:complete len:1075 (+) comp32822_c0_seq3:5-3229(+)